MMDDFAIFNEIFRYDMITGKLYWNVNRSRRQEKGKEAGSYRNGYRLVEYCGKPYSVHRIIWLLTYGNWPNGEIDHINGIKDDNRICNLRDVSHRGNTQNKDIHRAGREVGWFVDKQNGGFRAAIKLQYKRYHSKGGISKEEAIRWYKAASEAMESGTFKQWFDAQHQGFRGCYKEKNHWGAIFNGKRIGTYLTEEDAHQAYLAIRKDYFEKKVLIEEVE
jgi:hypothetical protein